jgi:hypothetical protein
MTMSSTQCTLTVHSNVHYNVHFNSCDVREMHIARTIRNVPDFHKMFIVKYI